MYKRIRDLREDADLSQSCIAEKLNISQRTYSHYEQGTRSLPVEILIALSQYYNVSMEYIVGLSDEKTPPKQN